MHGVVLLAIGVEAGDRVLLVQLIHLMADLTRLGVEPSQDAVEADDEVDAAERRVELLQSARRWR